MQYLATATLLTAATLSLAAPTATTNTTAPDLIPRSQILASINWFTRSDCRATCVEDGLCLTSPYEGIKGSDSEWMAWDTECWERPDSANSVSLSVNNGHKFSAINQDCKTYSNKGYNKPGFKAIDLKVAKFEEGEDKGYHKCNMFTGDRTKAVVYHW